MMNWMYVARKDFADMIRSRVLWILSGLMIAFALVGLYLPSVLESDPTGEDAVIFLSVPVMILVPILGLLVGYVAVIGERMSGSLRLLLTLPFHRWEVVFGKFVGRTMVLTVPITIGFTIGSLLLIPLYDAFPAVALAELFTSVIIVAIVYVAIAVGISSAVTSHRLAIAFVIAVFLLFEYLWGFVAIGLYYLVFGELVLGSKSPNWLQFVEGLSPIPAASTLSEFLFTTFGLTEDSSVAATGSGATETAGNTPLYLQDWVALVVIGVWIFVPLTIGYLQLRTEDIT